MGLAPAPALACVALASTLLIALALTACDEAPLPPPPPGDQAPTAAAPERAGGPPPAPRRADLSVDDALASAALSGALVGAIGSDIEREAMALIIEVTALLNKHLPDVAATLRALDAYNEQTVQRAQLIGARLYEQKLVNPRISQYTRAMRQRFEREVEAYERAVAVFEERASDVDILRFNAAMKRLTAPMNRAAP